MPSDLNQYLTKTRVTHDDIFTEFFLQHRLCAELFSVLLSDHEYSRFKWRTLQVEACEQFSVLGQRRIPDLVATVRLKDQFESLKLLCLLDHKSEAGAEVFWQLIEYAGIMIRRREVAVMPIVIYNGERPQWHGPKSLHQALPGMDGELGELFRKYVPEFELRVLNLRDDATQRRIGDLSIKSVLYAMGRIWNAGEPELEHLFRLGAALPLKERMEIIPRMVEYFHFYNKSITIERTMELEERVIRSEDDRIMQHAIYSWDVARKEGIKQGIKQGIEQGLEKARLQHAQKLLARGMSFEDICYVTELTPQQVQRLRNSMD